MNATFPDLRDAGVFVTGGGSGIGAAIVAGFAAQGARVAYADLDPGTPATGHKHTPLGLTCDVTDTAALQAAIDTAADAVGPFKAVVNLAANDQRMTAADITSATWDAMMDVNLKHYFFACQAAARHMPAGGAIINYASITYMMGAAGMAPYVTANAGIMGLTRALAREWGGQNIRVNAIAPGWVLTEKQLEKWATPDSLAAFIDKQCLKRHLIPDDMIGTTLFLASDASAMMTSQVLVLDGGVKVTG